MRTLITGITGFIGSNLAEKLLEEGHEVSGLVQPVIGRDYKSIEDLKSKANIYTCDIRDYMSVRESIRKSNPEVIFHLAALSPVRLSFEHPLEVQESNVLGTVNVAEATRDLYNSDGTRLIAASTAEVYGIQPLDKPFTEDLTLEPSSPYAVSKAHLDMYLRMMNKVYGSDVVIMRNSNTFGRKYDKGFFTEYLISEMLDNKDIYIGAPESIRDYMYVDDHVRGYLLAMDNSQAKGQVFNVSGGIGFTNKEWALKIADLLSFSKEKLHFGEYPPGYPKRPITSDQPYLVLDSSKAKNVLGWNQRVSLEEGLERTIDFWKK